MVDKKPSFIVDAMLGNLAKKLRLFGFDSLYYPDIDDDTIMQMAKNENRIILTSDELLGKRSEKQLLRVVLITEQDELEQFEQINQQINLGKFQITGKNARCSVCNGRLDTISKDVIKKQLPHGVLKQNNAFWICSKCKKIYWEGTHIKNLQEFTMKLNERL